MTQFVYKIMNRALWTRFEAEGICHGAPVDLEDGFIHLSDGSQVAETANRHFTGQTDLVLLRFNAAHFGDALKWEPSRHKALFPHLYRPLSSEEIVQVDALPLGPDGFHDFSGLLA